MPWKKRVILCAAALLLSGVPQLAAQTPWAAYLQEFRSTGGARRPWTLRVRKGDAPEGFWRRDDALSRLVADHDLSIETLEPEPAKTLWLAKEWSSGEHWLLLAREGDPAIAGDGRPTGEGLVAAIHDAGQRTGWERREDFLRQNPEQAEALEARLVSSLRLAMQRYRVCVDDHQATPIRVGEAGQWLVEPELAASKADEVFADAAESLERLLLVPDPWRLSGVASMLLEVTIKGCDARASRRMQTVLGKLNSVAEAAWARNPQQVAALDVQALNGPWSLWLSSEWVLTQGRITAFPRLEAAPGGIFPPYGLLSYAGTIFRDPKFLLAFLATVPTDPPRGPIDPAQWRAYTDRQYALLLLEAGAHGRLGNWDKVRSAVSEGRRWAGRRWTDWALGRDSEWFKQAPSDIQDLMNQPGEPDLPIPPDPGGRTRLEELDAFILTHPDHQDARRERFQLLCARLPNPKLEPVLAEDAARAWIPLNFPHGLADLKAPKIWSAQGARFLPEVEAALRRWPSSRELWRLWLSWLPFRAHPISIMSFAQGLALPGPLGAWRAELPKEAHVAVARELRDKAQFGLMQEWFQGAWEALLVRREPAVGNREALYLGLREALLGTRQIAAAGALTRQYLALPPEV